jgi:hypothetical protein
MKRVPPDKGKRSPTKSNTMTQHGLDIHQACKASKIKSKRPSSCLVGAICALVFFTISLTTVWTTADANICWAQETTRFSVAYIDSTSSTTKNRSESNESSNYLRFYPIILDDGSRITLISPTYFSAIATEVSQQVIETHHTLTTTFGAAPPFRTSIRIMDETDFYQLTGAPEWTNAMFFRGEIIIPLESGKTIDRANLLRSVKHEYSHAVLSAMSGGLIPGWIDEGLAQWIEGEENPVLKASLKKYLRQADPISLELLQGGFTKLPSPMVPAAYAESLIATQAIIRAYGENKIGRYLKNLRDGMNKEIAFESAFEISLGTFEEKLHQTLIHWNHDRPTGRSRTVLTKQNAERAQRRTSQY